MSDEEFEEPSPPDLTTVKARLLMLYANGARAYMEEAFAGKSEDEVDDIGRLRTWVFGKMKEFATAEELQRHDLRLGAIHEQLVIDDVWDVESAQPLMWALGLIDELPAWDQHGSWELLEEELFHLPTPRSWRPELTLRTWDEFEHQGMIAETRMWRIRCEDAERKDYSYIRKLLARSKILGLVELAEDGDLLMSDGRSFSRVTSEEVRLLGSITSERLRGLNWLCGQEQCWDDVTGDTIVQWLWDENWPEKPKSVFSKLLERFRKNGARNGNASNLEAASRPKHEDAG